MNENRNGRGRKHILFSLKIAAVMIGGALLLTWARKRGWADHDLVMRGYNVIMGLALAAYGNALPKLMHETPPRSIHEATLAQAVARVTSWVMTLAFLTWAALWAFAPLDIAKVGSMLAVGAGAVGVLAYTARKGYACRASRTD